MSKFSEFVIASSVIIALSPLWAPSCKNIPIPDTSVRIHQSALEAWNRQEQVARDFQAIPFKLTGVWRIEAHSREPGPHIHGRTTEVVVGVQFAEPVKLRYGWERAGEGSHGYTMPNKSADWLLRFQLSKAEVDLTHPPADLARLIEDGLRRFWMEVQNADGEWVTAMDWQAPLEMGK